MKLKERVRLGTVIRRIYELFKPRPILGKKPSFRRRRIPASEIEVPGSAVTRQRARDCLGVVCMNVAGRHVWLHPVYNLEDALKRAARNSKATVYQAAESRKKRGERDAKEIAKVLRTIMEQNGYDQPPKQVLAGAHALLGRTYPRGVMGKARREAGIISKRWDGKFHWLYRNKEVQVWLTIQLSVGPVEQSLLFELAFNEKGWTDRVINLFRTGYGFKQYYTSAQCIWYDMNTWSPS